MTTMTTAGSKRKPLLAQDPFRGPHPGVTIPYLIVGEAGFLLALILATLHAPELLEFYYQGRVLALTHLVTVGWITMTIMGASFLVVPMIFRVPLWGERLGRVQFACMLAGLSTLVGSFWVGRYDAASVGAGLVLAGTSLYLVIMAMTLRRLDRPDVALNRYAPRRAVGEDVPTVNSLSSPRRQALTFGLFVPGTLLGAAGLLIQSAAILQTGLLLLTIGLLVFEADMLAVSRHLWSGNAFGGQHSAVSLRPNGPGEVCALCDPPVKPPRSFLRHHW